MASDSKFKIMTTTDETAHAFVYDEQGLVQNFSVGDSVEYIGDHWKFQGCVGYIEKIVITHKPGKSIKKIWVRMRISSRYSPTVAIYHSTFPFRNLNKTEKENA